ncbi:hypothetical protein [Janthinobacterium sp.]|uniref:hypothetical protein n=1 Tax=Janthinobacterium sp. TaxID=1871054 RepID=UPI00258E6473|nr:hypothetical protein [Janthinobacterium sp.]MCX7290931.1 hypothetical protein [Janthinobacterium sp.]
MDKVVDKPLLTSRNTSIDAGFNNLLISQAIFYPNEINDLESCICASAKLLGHHENIFCGASGKLAAGRLA